MRRFPRARRTVALILVVALCTYGTTAAPAAANPLKRACGVVGAVSSLFGRACNVLSDPGRIVKAGKKLVTGHPGGAVTTLLDGGAATATAAVGLTALGAWVLTSASFALHETTKLIGKTTTPQLRTTWFSATYWRMSGIAAVLTLPFLFAAVVQALLRSDLALLVRAALGYLPLAMLSIAIAGPLTMLLLAASDQMSAVVSSAAGNAGAAYLARAGTTLGGLSVIAAPFIAFLIGLLTAAGAVVLWFELLMRDAAVYVIVLMLPLVFAALVWPSRRIWAVRAVELLVALIFAKFVIVAVLSLGGAALSGGAAPSVAGWLAGLVILVMGALAPWAMLRLLPLADLAGSAVQSLHSDARTVGLPFGIADGLARRGDEWATTMVAEMRRDREAVADVLGAVRSPGRPAVPPSEPAVESEPVADDLWKPDPPELQPVPAASAQAGERLPDLGGQWQAKNFSWRPLALGPEESWPSPTVWSPDDTDDAAAPGPVGSRPREAITGPLPDLGPPASPSLAVAGVGTPPPAATDSTGPGPGPALDDPDPLPPAQDPPEGRL
ncbi:MAG: hypothetical protein M3018_11350 [Actinomycetota bacterium]|nr:hypothetical protein [Actinomycetota bacterium]